MLRAGAAVGTAQEGAAAAAIACFPPPAHAPRSVCAGTRQSCLPAWSVTINSLVPACPRLPLPRPFILPHTAAWCGWEEGAQGWCCEPGESWRPLACLPPHLLWSLKTGSGHSFTCPLSHWGGGGDRCLGWLLWPPALPLRHISMQSPPAAAGAGLRLQDWDRASAGGRASLI